MVKSLSISDSEDPTKFLINVRRNHQKDKRGVFNSDELKNIKARRYGILKTKKVLVLLFER